MRRFVVLVVGLSEWLVAKNAKKENRSNFRWHRVDGREGLQHPNGGSIVCEVVCERPERWGVTFSTYGMQLLPSNC